MPLTRTATHTTGIHGVAFPQVNYLEIEGGAARGRDGPRDRAAAAAAGVGVPLEEEKGGALWNLRWALPKCCLGGGGSGR